MKILLNVLGIVVLLSALYFFSSNKKLIDKKMILKALVLQFVLAFLLVKFPLGQTIIEKVSDVVTNILGYGAEGISFVFGSLSDSSAPTGSIFGIQVLGNIIFISALVAALYYLGVIGFIVKIIGKVVGKILGTTEVESFVAVANMFLGQTESPVLVSKYLGRMTNSEIVVVLVSGMGSMSATIIGGYTALGIPMKYLLIASALVPIGSIAIAKILLPESEKDMVKSLEEVSVSIEKDSNTNLLGAIADGAMSGLQTVLAIGASLIAIIGLVALVNGFLGIFNLSLEQIFSYIFAPLGFLMGVDSNEILTAGQLLGSKLVLNEFVAFQQLGSIFATLGERTQMVLSIALAGFANISSIGICISGISALCPEKKNTLAKLAFKSMIGGFAVSILSAMIVGIVF